MSWESCGNNGSVCERERWVDQLYTPPCPQRPPLYHHCTMPTPHLPSLPSLEQRIKQLNNTYRDRSLNMSASARNHKRKKSSRTAFQRERLWWTKCHCCWWLCLCEDEARGRGQRFYVYSARVSCVECRVVCSCLRPVQGPSTYNHITI